MLVWSFVNFEIAFLSSDGCEKPAKPVAASEAIEAESTKSIVAETTKSTIVAKSEVVGPVEASVVETSSSSPIEGSGPSASTAALLQKGCMGRKKGEEG